MFAPKRDFDTHCDFVFVSLLLRKFVELKTVTIVLCLLMLMDNHRHATFPNPRCPQQAAWLRGRTGIITFADLSSPLKVKLWMAMFSDGKLKKQKHQLQSRSSQEICPRLTEN
jgi:hypothetical protein